MKKWVFTTFVLFICLFSQSQNSNFIDSRLFEVYPSEFLSELQTNNPQALEYMNWYLDNSFTIIELPEYKLEGLPFLMYYDIDNKNVSDTVTELPTPSINIYKFHFERKNDLTTTYRIGDTGLAIVFFSEKELINKFNQFKNKK